MTTNNDIERRLWAAADQLWANSNLKPSEFSTPTLGLIFLRYADHKFTQAEATLAAKAKASRGRRRS
jgi:type I restriction enzyme M protein